MGHRPVAERRQPLGLGGVEEARPELVREGPGDVRHVGARVALGRHLDLAAERLLVAQVDRTGQRLDLGAVVVDVVLARDLVPAPGEQARHPVAHHGVAAVPDVHGAGGVGRDVLDDDPPPLPHRGAAEGGALLLHLGQRPVPHVRREPEVHEARARHFQGGDLARLVHGAQGLDDPLGQLPRRLARALGEDQGGVDGEVAVPRVARRLDGEVHLPAGPASLGGSARQRPTNDSGDSLSHGPPMITGRRPGAQGRLLAAVPSPMCRSGGSARSGWRIAAAAAPAAKEPHLAEQGRDQEVVTSRPAPPGRGPRRRGAAPASRASPRRRASSVQARPRAEQRLGGAPPAEGAGRAGGAARRSRGSGESRSSRSRPPAPGRRAAPGPARRAAPPTARRRARAPWRRAPPPGSPHAASDLRRAQQRVGARRARGVRLGRGGGGPLRIRLQAGAGRGREQVGEQPVVGAAAPAAAPRSAASSRLWSTSTSRSPSVARRSPASASGR